jgi:hypothetical protein
VHDTSATYELGVELWTPSAKTAGRAYSHPSADNAEAPIRITPAIPALIAMDVLPTWVVDCRFMMPSSAVTH